MEGISERNKKQRYKLSEEAKSNPGTVEYSDIPWHLDDSLCDYLNCRAEKRGCKKPFKHVSGPLPKLNPNEKFFDEYYEEQEKRNKENLIDKTTKMCLCPHCEGHTPHDAPAAAEEENAAPMEEENADTEENNEHHQEEEEQDDPIEAMDLDRTNHVTEEVPIVAEPGAVMEEPQQTQGTLAIAAQPPLRQAMGPPQQAISPQM
jgi:hypothetical protein